MKWLKNIALITAMTLLIDSCIQQHEYSTVPHIDLQSISYKKGNGNPRFDTMAFVLTFKDGDGDLGLNPDDSVIYTSQGEAVDVTDKPFYYVYDTVQNSILGYVHSSGLDLTAYGNNLSYLDYKAKRTHRIDTLPELSCDHYEYGTDTVYYQKNINGSNIFIYAYYKDGNSYTLFDPNIYFASNHICYNQFFIARFPVMASDPGKKSPLDGTITYKYPSLALPAFLGLTVKFKIYITDRTYLSSERRFQHSNVIETGDYKF